MRRVILMLTEAQASWLRGAVRTYAEDMGIAGLQSGHDDKHVEAILKQLNAPPRTADQGRQP